MAARTLRLYTDRLGPKAATPLARGDPGDLRARRGCDHPRRGPGRDARREQRLARRASRARSTAGSNGATLLRWELVPVEAPAGEAPGADSRLAAAHAVELPDPGGYLMRLDRVDFPPGGIAYLHTHRGPGIRCLLAGEIRVEVNGAAHALKPGEAWFEAGPDPVLAHAAEREPTSFARVMILPRELKGKSSIRYVRAEDHDKPKTQRYQVFCDEFITP